MLFWQVNSSLDNPHFLYEQQEKKVQNFRTFTIIKQNLVKFYNIIDFVWFDSLRPINNLSVM